MGPEEAEVVVAFVEPEMVEPAGDGVCGGGGGEDWPRHWRTEAEQSQYCEGNVDTCCELQTEPAWLSPTVSCTSFSIYT